jgi:hypothetical protein
MVNEGDNNFYVWNAISGNLLNKQASKTILNMEVDSKKLVVMNPFSVEVWDAQYGEVPWFTIKCTNFIGDASINAFGNRLLLDNLITIEVLHPIINPKPIQIIVVDKSLKRYMHSIKATKVIQTLLVVDLLIFTVRTTCI